MPSSRFLTVRHAAATSLLVATLAVAAGCARRDDAPTVDSALARDLWDVDRLSSFFDIIHQDPVLSVVAVIFEP